jgi:hypothetical protein
MARDYGQAAVRHFIDAETLAAAGRYDDAGHLIGLAAECALKHGAQGFTNPKNAEIEGHLPPIKRTIQSILQGRNAKGPLLGVVGKREFFDNWNVNDRYQADGHVNKSIYDSWRADAQLAFRIVSLRLTPAK